MVSATAAVHGVMVIIIATSWRGQKPRQLTAVVVVEQNSFDGVVVGRCASRWRLLTFAARTLFDSRGDACTTAYIRKCYNNCGLYIKGTSGLYTEAVSFV